MRSKTKHPKWCQLNHMRRLDFECFILESSDEDTGIRPKNNIQKIGRKHNLWRYQELASVFKVGDKMFCPHNSSRPTLLKYLELAYNKYISYDYKDKTKKVEKQQIKESTKQVQQELPFESDVKIQCIDLKTAKEAFRQVLVEAGITKQFQLVNRFIREWNGDNNTVN